MWHLVFGEGHRMFDVDGLQSKGGHGFDPHRSVLDSYLPCPPQADDRAQIANEQHARRFLILVRHREPGGVVVSVGSVPREKCPPDFQVDA